jgi:hypothetical protein
MPSRQPDRAQPPTASDLTACPSCGEDRLGPHCDNDHRCRWLLCAACRSFGIPGWRWCDMRQARPA